MTKNMPPRRNAWSDDEIPISPWVAREKPDTRSMNLPASWGKTELDKLPDSWGLSTQATASENLKTMAEGNGGVSMDGSVSPEQSDEAAEVIQSINQTPVAFTPPVPQMTVMLRNIAAPQVLEEEPKRPKRVRNRNWEKAHNEEVVCFRAIPEAVHEMILWLADDQQVSAGQIARALLEYAVDCYQRGILSLTPELSSGKRTLFPTVERPVGWSRNISNRVAKPIGRKKAKTRKSKVTGLISVNYREIPKTLQNTLREISTDRDVPMTEVARFFFQYALNDLENGTLILAPMKI